jgi:integrase
MGNTRKMHHRALLSTIYATGARLNEAVHLKVADIDGERMLVHIRHGKGGKPRMVPMSPALRELLREYWRVRRPLGYLFPGESGDGALHGTGVQKMFRLARLTAGIDKPASVHTLRHSYATHLLELATMRSLVATQLSTRAALWSPPRAAPLRGGPVAPDPMPIAASTAASFNRSYPDEAASNQMGSCKHPRGFIWIGT